MAVDLEKCYLVEQDVDGDWQSWYAWEVILMDGGVLRLRTLVPKDDPRQMWIYLSPARGTIKVTDPKK